MGRLLPEITDLGQVQSAANSLFNVLPTTRTHTLVARACEHGVVQKVLLCLGQPALYSDVYENVQLDGTENISAFDGLGMDRSRRPISLYNTCGIDITALTSKGGAPQSRFYLFDDCSSEWQSHSQSVISNIPSPFGEVVVRPSGTHTLTHFDRDRYLAESR